MEKRYYWLKLKEDFFSSKRIKKLRRIAGGDTYTLIYLKMQLKALKTDGVLTYSGLESTFAEELALDIDEDPENVGLVINYCLSCGLMETSDKTNFLLPYVVENTGSEGSSAQRMRTLRANQDKALTDSAKTESVTLCAQSATMCAHRYGEKEIEKEKELEIETEKEKKRHSVPVEYFPELPELDQTFRDYIKMRKTIKAPMSDKAITLAMSKLRKLATDPMTDAFDEQMAIDILNQSIMNSWKGLYQVKEESKRGGGIDWSKV